MWFVPLTMFVIQYNQCSFYPSKHKCWRYTRHSKHFEMVDEWCQPCCQPINLVRRGDLVVFLVAACCSICKLCCLWCKVVRVHSIPSTKINRKMRFYIFAVSDSHAKVGYLKNLTCKTTLELISARHFSACCCVNWMWQGWIFYNPQNADLRHLSMFAQIFGACINP